MALLGAAGGTPNAATYIPVIVSTLASAAVIYLAVRNSIKKMVERVVAEKIVDPLAKIHDRIDKHMEEEVAIRKEDERVHRDEERSRRSREDATAQVVAQTATDVAYLRGKLEP